MAAKTPVSVGTAGYVDPVRGLYVGPLADDEQYLDEGSYITHRRQLVHRVLYFADIDDGDTWASGIPNILACAWQGNDAAADNDVVQATAAASGTVTFRAEASNSKGWLHLFIDDKSGKYGLAAD